MAVSVLFNGDKDHTAPTLTDIVTDQGYSPYWSLTGPTIRQYYCIIVLMYNDIHNIVAFHAEVNNEYEKV